VSGGPAADPGSRSQTVALVTFPYGPSASSGRGVDRYAFEIVQGLRARGATVEVLGAEGRSPSLGRLVLRAWSLYRRARRDPAYVYHAVDPLGAAIVALAGRRPLVLTAHDSLYFASPHLLDPHPLRVRFYLMRRLTRYAVARSSAVVVPFASTRREMAAVVPSSGPKLRQVPYGLTGVPRAATAPDPDGPGAGASAPARLLYMGGGQPIARGGRTCVGLVRALKDRGLPVRLRVVGLGPDLDLLRRHAASLGVAAEVEFSAPFPEAELLPRIAEHDVFVYPSILGFSFLVLQAMMAGVPVVVGRDRDLPEFVDGAGFACPREDVSAFAEAVSRLLGDPVLRQRTIEAATARAREYSADRMVDGLLGVYRETAASAPPVSDSLR
jgi:glycosyltransferase involved in cell wall biosynthesis